MTDTKTAWRINAETPSVIITPHGRIAINWSEQFAGGEVNYDLAEATAAMIVETVNARHASQSLSTDEEVRRLREERAAGRDEGVEAAIACIRSVTEKHPGTPIGRSADLLASTLEMMRSDPTWPDIVVEAREALQSKDTPSHGG